MTFSDIRDRLLRLRHDQIEPADAKRELDRLGGLAARTYRRYADGGRAGFDADLADPRLVSVWLDDPANERLWLMTWRMLTIGLAAKWRDQLPAMFGAAEPTGTVPCAGGGIFVSAMRYPPARWRERAEDWAALCGLLAELAGESSATTGATPAAGAKTSELETSLKEPSDVAMKAYRAHKIMGMKQADVARTLTTKSRKVEQWQVSRWSQEVARWIAAGNVLPDLNETAKITSVDPNRLDLGKRVDTGILKRREGQKARTDG